jgi:hypothetical protein
LLKRFLVAHFVAFLHFSEQIRLYTSPWNRFYALWERWQGLALVADLLLASLGMTTAAVLAEYAVRRWRSERLRRLFGALFLLALVSGVAAALPLTVLRERQSLALGVWIAGMGMVGFSLGRDAAALVRRAATLCLLFSPIGLFSAVQVLSWPSWQEPPRAQVPIRPAAPSHAPVFVFIFDEWSYPRSTVGGEFRPLFRNLREVCERATMFREAHSPGDQTEVSIPRLLFQNDLDLEPRAGQTWWRGGDPPVRTADTPSLFRRAQEAGDSTYMVGFYLPYPRLLGEQVDYCHTYRFEVPAGRTFLGEMGRVGLYSMAHWADPVVARLTQPWRSRIVRDHYRRLNDQFNDEMLRILGECPRNTFAVFHVMLPHWPFYWSEDGTFRNPMPEPGWAGYERNLRYLDTMVGWIVQRLRDRQMYDDALLILTSDHSLREEPEPAMSEGKDYSRHVPLVIKLPGQRTGVVNDSLIHTNRLLPLFEAVLAGEHDPDRLLGIVGRLSEEGAPSR